MMQHLVIHSLLLLSSLWRTVTCNGYEPPYMLVAHSRYISVIDMEGNVLNNSIVRDEHGILSIDYHFRMEEVYWIARTGFIRKTSFVDFEDIEMVAFDSSAWDLAVDWLENVLYWSSRDNFIHKLDLITNARLENIEVSGFPQFTYIIVNPFRRVIYVTESTLHTLMKIEYGTTEGDDVFPEYHPLCPMLSFHHEAIFWYQIPRLIYFQRSGNQPLMKHIIREDHVVENQYYNGDLYWLQKEGIYRKTWNDTKEEEVKLTEFTSLEVVSDMVIVDEGSQPLSLNFSYIPEPPEAAPLPNSTVVVSHSTTSEGNAVSTPEIESTSSKPVVTREDSRTLVPSGITDKISLTTLRASSTSMMTLASQSHPPLLSPSSSIVLTKTPSSSSGVTTGVTGVTPGHTESVRSSKFQSHSLTLHTSQKIVSVGPTSSSLSRSILSVITSSILSEVTSSRLNSVIPTISLLPSRTRSSVTTTDHSTTTTTSPYTSSLSPSSILDVSLLLTKSTLSTPDVNRTIISSSTLIIPSSSSPDVYHTRSMSHSIINPTKASTTAQLSSLYYETPTPSSVNGDSNDVIDTVVQKSSSITTTIEVEGSHDSHMTSMQSTVEVERSHDSHMTSMQSTIGSHKSHVTSLQSTIEVEGSHDSHVTSLQSTTIEVEGSHDSHVTSLQSTIETTGSYSTSGSPRIETTPMVELNDPAIVFITTSNQRDSAWDAVITTCSFLGILLLIIIVLAVIDTIYYFGFERKREKMRTAGFLGGLLDCFKFVLRCFFCPNSVLRRRRTEESPYVPRRLEQSYYHTTLSPEQTIDTLLPTDRSGSLAIDHTGSTTDQILPATTTVDRNPRTSAEIRQQIDANNFVIVTSNEDASGDNTSLYSSASSLNGGDFNYQGSPPSPELTQLEMDTKIVLEEDEDLSDEEFDKEDLTGH